MIVSTDIGYGPTYLRISCSMDALDLIRGELEPFFVFDAPTKNGTKIASLTVLNDAAPDIIPRNPGVTIEVDTSLYKHLASSGRRWSDGDQTVVRIDLTNTILKFERQTSTIELWQPDAGLAHVDTVRTIKSLFTPALESLGCVQLHSAGVVDSDGGILILGDMWQGKTTLLLEFLSDFAVAQLSCDTVVAWQRDGEGVTASGWPSPFSMSHGTMSDHPQLYPFYPFEQRKTPYAMRWQERRKTVLESEQVVELFQTTMIPSVPRVHSVVIARFKPSESTRIEKITSEKELVDYLQSVYLGSRDPIYHNWHKYVICVDEDINKNIERFARALLQSADVHVMTWAPSASSLLKQIPRLARLHKFMKDIVDY
jgi:hypothetical protein